jgi:predicted translin family RNA/ssDNA-binding protein
MAVAPHNDEIKTEIFALSREHANKCTVAIVLEKEYQRDVNGLRQRNDHYRGSVSQVYAQMYETGKCGSSIQLWP